MQIVEQPDIFLMEFFLVRCLVEIQVATTQFITALACQQHLNVSIFRYPLRYEIQSSTGSNSRDIECFAHLYDDIQLVEPLFLRDLHVRMD